MLIVSRLVAECANLRCESRGTHYRTDHPAARAALAGKHTELSHNPRRGLVTDTDLRLASAPPTPGSQPAAGAGSEPV